MAAVLAIRYPDQCWRSSNKLASLALARVPSIARQSSRPSRIVDPPGEACDFTFGAGVIDRQERNAERHTEKMPVVTHRHRDIRRRYPVQELLKRQITPLNLA